MESGDSIPKVPLRRRSGNRNAGFSGSWEWKVVIPFPRYPFSGELGIEMPVFQDPGNGKQ